jgi:hypothetical protein
LARGETKDSFGDPFSILGDWFQKPVGDRSPRQKNKSSTS